MGSPSLSSLPRFWISLVLMGSSVLLGELRSTSSVVDAFVTPVAFTTGTTGSAAAATTAGTTVSASLLLADGAYDSAAASLLSSSSSSLPSVWDDFQNNHTFLQGLVLTIVVKLVVGEIRKKIEKPIMDEAGRRIANATKTQLTPDTDEIKVGDWAKLIPCVAMDLAGDASELIPVLGEFTDVAFAPTEAALLQVLFKSPAISAFGFVEEILPFTDVVPTFTMSWILSTLFPTTPLAKGLLPSKDKETEQ